jgi:hypothetical protein
MSNEFLVSVANAIGRDANTGNLLFMGKADINSALTVTMAKTEVRGGINNPLLYTYFHDRAVEVKIEQAIFTETLLALNAGTSITSTPVTVVKNESVTFSSGSIGYTTQTPIGNVGVVMSTGAIQNITPSGSTITVPLAASQTLDVVYTYTATADQVIGYATLPPTAIDLTLIAEVRDTTQSIVRYFELNIPRFSLSGAYTLSLAANGVSNQAIDGFALVQSDSSGEYYYKATWISTGTSQVPVTSIAATPTVLNFSYALKPQTMSLNVLGIRGGNYANTNITTSCSYVKTSGCGNGNYTIGASTGVVTATSAVHSGDAQVFTITYFDTYSSASLVDVVNALCGN